MVFYLTSSYILRSFIYFCGIFIYNFLVSKKNYYYSFSFKQHYVVVFSFLCKKGKNYIKRNENEKLQG